MGGGGGGDLIIMSGHLKNVLFFSADGIVLIYKLLNPLFLASRQW